MSIDGDDVALTPTGMFYADAVVSTAYRLALEQAIDEARRRINPAQAPLLDQL